MCLCIGADRGFTAARGCPHPSAPTPRVCACGRGPVAALWGCLVTPRFPVCELPGGWFALRGLVTGLDRRSSVGSQRQKTATVPVVSGSHCLRWPASEISALRLLNPGELVEPGENPESDAVKAAWCAVVGGGGRVSEATGSSGLPPSEVSSHPCPLHLSDTDRPCR